MNILKLNLVMITSLGTCFVCCKSESSNDYQISKPKRLPDLSSSAECPTRISIWFEKRDQFVAKIDSDIPIYDNVIFSGYYIKGKTFYSLHGLSDSVISLNLIGNGVFMRENLSKEDAVNQGWLMIRRKSTGSAPTNH